MITKKLVKEIYKQDWSIYENLSELELKEITDNINGNLKQYISDEIRYYLENR